jgi:hypothetical protein
MSAEFIESILHWKEGADRPAVLSWLQARGLGHQEMPSGILVNGTGAAFAAAFGTDINPETAPLDLPLPAALQPHVDRIGVLRPPRLHRP